MWIDLFKCSSFCQYYLNGPISEAIGIPESPSSSDFHVIVDIVHSEAAAEVMQLPSLSVSMYLSRSFVLYVHSKMIEDK